MIIIIQEMSTEESNSIKATTEVRSHWSSRLHCVERYFKLVWLHETYVDVQLEQVDIVKFPTR